LIDTEDVDTADEEVEVDWSAEVEMNRATGEVWT